MAETSPSDTSSSGSSSNSTSPNGPQSPQSPLGFQITTEAFFTTYWRPDSGKNVRTGRFITQLHLEPYTYSKDLPRTSMGENVWRFRCNNCRRYKSKGTTNEGRNTYAYAQIVGHERNGDPIWRLLKTGKPHTCHPPDFHVFMNKVLLNK